MSKTWNGAPRKPDDYYITPLRSVHEFAKEFLKQEKLYDLTACGILDPCAGGSCLDNNPNRLGMPYPEVLSHYGANDITTIDIRPDSLARYQGNFLTAKLPGRYDLIVSNPPFSLAQEFIERALISVVDGGFVSFLLRLGFYGSQKRFDWWQRHPTKYTMVHSIRPSFTGKANGKGKTDGAEYAHFVWQKGYSGPSQILVI